MNFPVFFFISLAMSGCVLANILPVQPTTTQKPKEMPIDSYVPHSTYLSANSYVDDVPYGVAFNPDSFRPPQRNNNEYNGMMPSVRSSLDIIVWLITRIGAVFFGSTVLFILGSIFNALVCSVTSLCNYDFQALSKMDNESVRALITPEKISTAAALVQDAIGKYNRLQREIRN